MALYREPQKDMEWDRWNTQLRAPANTQEVDRVLDPNFHPRDAEDWALFEADDARIIAETDRVVNVQGIRDHQVTDLKIVSAGGVVDSQHGPVIAIFHQYAHMGSGKSIHSSIQLEAFGLEVNDKSCKVAGGRQRLSHQMDTSTPFRSRMALHTPPCDHTRIRNG